METHGHELHKAPGRGLKHYFYEFLMLFFAVTLGFYAENIREHFAERKHEKVLIQSMVDDLKNDTGEIRFATGFLQRVSLGLDTLINSLYNISNGIKAPYLSRLSSTYSRINIFASSDKASSQLKAGGMSYIKSQSVADDIAEHWENEKTIETIQNIYITKMTDAINLSNRIFNGKFVHIKTDDSITGLTILKVDSNTTLVSKDTVLLYEYANKLNSANRTLKYYYIPSLQDYSIEAKEIIGRIKKEYNLK